MITSPASSPSAKAIDPFATVHSNGIKLPYFSPSTVSSFIESRYNFYQSKVVGKPFSGNHHTARGTAVEHGVNTWIENPDTEDLLAVSLAKYDEEIAKGTAGKRDAAEFRESIKGLLEVALRHYKRMHAECPLVTQRKIETELVGVNRGMLGYLDYFQFEHAVRDSKVTGKSPFKLKQAYVLQGSVYRQATGLPVFFDFFVANKAPVHKCFELSDDEYTFGISYITRAAQVLEELEECDNPKRVMELMSFPNLEAFYSEGEMRAAAKTWGIVVPL